MVPPHTLDLTSQDTIAHQEKLHVSDQKLQTMHRGMQAPLTCSLMRSTPMLLGQHHHQGVCHMKPNTIMRRVAKVKSVVCSVVVDLCHFQRMLQLQGIAVEGHQHSFQSFTDFFYPNEYHTDRCKELCQSVWLAGWHPWQKC